MRHVSCVTIVVFGIGAAAFAEPRPFPPKTGPDPSVVGPSARSRSYPDGYATRLDYPAVERSSHRPRVGASTYVYLHALPPRLSSARERYRARLHLTVDPIFPSRLLQDLPNDQLRTELDLLWTPRTDLAPVLDAGKKVVPSEANPWDLFFAGRVVAASERFIDLAIDSPDDPEPKLGFALAQLAEGDLGGAQFALRRATELADGGPALPEDRRESAELIVNTIASALTDHLEAAPSDFEARLTLAIMLTMLGEQEAALDHAEQARDRRPRDPVATLLIERLAPSGESSPNEP